MCSGGGEGAQANEWWGNPSVAIGQQPSSSSENSQASSILTGKEIPTFILCVNSDAEGNACSFVPARQAVKFAFVTVWLMNLRSAYKILLLFPPPPR